MGEEKSELYPVKIRIKNFQSIEDLEIEVRGFTAITGKTNIGKSAIMRAISSAMLGDSVIGLVRKGASYCSVEMSSENWGFRWEKGEKGINRYIINGVTYDKPGQRQLDEIVRMGFGSVKLGSKEVQPWWASQFFPIFLLGETGPAVTDFISEVSRLTILQDAVVLSSRGKRRANEEAKNKSEEAQKIHDRLTGVSGTDQMIRICKELDDQRDSIDEYDNRIRNGDELSSKLRVGTERIAVLEPADRVKISRVGVEEFDNIQSMHGFWMKLEESAMRIISLKPSEKLKLPELPEEEWKHLFGSSRFLGIDKMKDRAAILDGVKNVTIPELDCVEELSHIRNGENYLSKLLSSARTIRALSNKIDIPNPPDELEKIQIGEILIEKLVTTLSEKNKLDNEKKSIQTELMEIEKQLSEIPSCPSCGRPVCQHSS